MINHSLQIEKIVSGGQTGADRAALDVAIQRGIPHAGWCPKGRLAEDGPISAAYNLRETPTDNYPQRTEWNVRDSDGTVIFTITPVLKTGSKETFTLAQKRGKPVIHISRESSTEPATDLLRFICQNQIRVLNVAGTRASKEPAVRDFVIEVLRNTLDLVTPNSKGV